MTEDPVVHPARPQAVEGKLSSLQVGESDQQRKVNTSYTVFIRIMRYVFPVVAICMVLVVFIWPQLENDITVIKEEDLILEVPSAVRKNELLKPDFKTIDQNGNPLHVQAVRALQDQTNPKLIQLETPTGRFQLSSGELMNVSAAYGTYEQEQEKLYLKENVIILHENGYEIDAAELRVNLKTQEAFSDKELRVRGEEGQIEALGIEGSLDAGTLIFKGPAKLIFQPSQNDGVEQEQE